MQDKLVPRNLHWQYEVSHLFSHPPVSRGTSIIRVDYAGARYERLNTLLGSKKRRSSYIILRRNLFVGIQPNSYLATIPSVYKFTARLKLRVRK